MKQEYYLTQFFLNYKNNNIKNINKIFNLLKTDNLFDSFNVFDSNNTDSTNFSYNLTWSNPEAETKTKVLTEAKTQAEAEAIMIETPATEQEETPTQTAEETVIEETETPVTEEIATETPVTEQEETPSTEETPTQTAEETVVEETETPVTEEIATETPATEQEETPNTDEPLVYISEAQLKEIEGDSDALDIDWNTYKATFTSAKPTINNNIITFPNGTIQVGQNPVINDDGSVTDTIGGSIIIKYNAKGQMIYQEYNMNNIINKLGYDDKGNLTSNITTDKEGNKLSERTYEYYDNGNKKSETISQQASNGEMITTKTAIYSEAGKETYFKSLDISGNVSQLREYADNGTLIHEVNCSNYAEKSEKFYDENTGKITKEITEDNFESSFGSRNSAITKYTYNNETGKLTSKISTDADGNQTTTQYDVNENVTSEITTDKEGNVTSTKTFEYYSDGVQKSSKEYNSSNECIEDLQYNEQGKLTKSVRKSSYYTETCEYNDDGKLISSSITDKNGDVTSTNAKEYYSNGRLKSKTSYSYDEKGVATPIEQVTYSQKGKETSYKKWDSNGNLTDLREYDANTGKLTREIDAYYSWNFDKNWNQQYYLSSQTEKIYDANTGKIINSIYTNSDGEETKTEYEYNDSGKETKQTVSVNNVVTQETDTEYYNDGTKKAKNEYTYKNGEKIQTLQATYDTFGKETYYKKSDSNGEISELREYSSETGKKIKDISTDIYSEIISGINSAKTEKTYDANTGRITQVINTTTDEQTTTKNYEYTYDENGKVTGGKITTLNPDGTKVVSEYTYKNSSISFGDNILLERLNTQISFSSTKYDKDGNKIGEYSNNNGHEYISRLSYGNDAPCATLETLAEEIFKQQASATPTIEGNTIKFACKSITFKGTAVVNDDGTVSVTSEDEKFITKYNKTGAVISCTYNPDYTLGDNSVYIAPSSSTTKNEDGSITVTAKSGCTTTLDSDGNVTDATDMYGESLSNSTLATECQLSKLAGVRALSAKTVSLSITPFFNFIRLGMLKNFA